MGKGNQRAPLAVDTEVGVEKRRLERSGTTRHRQDFHHHRDEFLVRGRESGQVVDGYDGKGEEGFPAVAGESTSV